MADWVVRIRKTDEGDTEFVVDGAQQGQPLSADQFDLVHWSNMTNDPHQVWQTDSNYKRLDNGQMTGIIQGGDSSAPYRCTQPKPVPPAAPASEWTVYYFCNSHPTNQLERGSIEVTALPIQINFQDGPGDGQVTVDQPSLSVSSGQTINFTNATQWLTLQPWQTDQNFKPLAQSNLSPVPLQPGDSTRAYTVKPPAGTPPNQSWTLYYCCKLDGGKTSGQGKIIVVPSQASSD